MKKFLSVFLSVLVLLCAVSMIPEVKAERFFADGFNGSTYEGSSTEIVDFARKDDEEVSIKGAVPKYSNIGVYQNTCANTAGAILLGYYEKSYDELIPNFKAARVIRDKVLFATQTDAVQKVIDELYVKMDTNNGGNGTTINGFKNGLRQYVDEKGRNIEYTSIVSNEDLSIERYKEAIEVNKPIVLFVSKYTMIPLTEIYQNDYSDKYNKKLYGGDHVLVAYGIREIQYYSSAGNLTKSTTLLMVATGYSQDPLVYVQIDDRMRIIDGYTVNIY